MLADANGPGSALAVFGSCHYSRMFFEKEFLIVQLPLITVTMLLLPSSSNNKHYKVGSAQT